MRRSPSSGCRGHLPRLLVQALHRTVRHAQVHASKCTRCTSGQSMTISHWATSGISLRQKVRCNRLGLRTCKVTTWRTVPTAMPTVAWAWESKLFRMVCRMRQTSVCSTLGFSGNSSTVRWRHVTASAWNSPTVVWEQLTTVFTRRAAACRVIRRQSSAGSSRRTTAVGITIGSCITGAGIRVSFHWRLQGLRQVFTVRSIPCALIDVVRRNAAELTSGVDVPTKFHVGHWKAILKPSRIRVGILIVNFIHIRLQYSAKKVSPLQ